MKRKTYLEEITGSVHDIPQRLKEIDPEYRVFYNKQKRRFEIYWKGEQQLTLPYGELDARCLEKVRETRVSRLDRLFA